MNRSHASAFLLGTLAALVVDAVMQLAIDAVRVSRFGGGAPWWVTTNVIGRGRWVVFAALLWWLAPRLGGGEANPRQSAMGSAQDAWRQVAVALVAVPVLWIVATWLVSAVRFTALGSWDTDGRVFLSPDYYRGLALGLTPWAMAAAALIAVRRHF
jgi:ABC-type amino acid transport system permease subunit